MSIAHLKREAKERGLKWAHVKAVYAEMRRQIRAAREHPNAVREAAWCMHTASTPGCWSFWRNGFRRYAKRIAKGADYTVVRGYDEIAQQIKTLFPEYDTPDGTERLWEFLLARYEPYPTAADVYRRAMDWLEAIGNDKTSNKTDDVPF